jgi:hypothetical protein
MIGSAAAQSAETIAIGSHIGLASRRGKAAHGPDQFVDEGGVFLGVGVP